MSGIEIDQSDLELLGDLGLARADLIQAGLISNPQLTFYAPNGPVAFKNNAQFNGAIYANDIVLKNNLHVVYDPRVDQIVGFGPVTLQTESWTETTH